MQPHYEKLGIYHTGILFPGENSRLMRGTDHIQFAVILQSYLGSCSPGIKSSMYMATLYWGKSIKRPKRSPWSDWHAYIFVQKDYSFPAFFFFFNVKRNMNLNASVYKPISNWERGRGLIRTCTYRMTPIAVCWSISYTFSEPSCTKYKTKWSDMP